MPACMHVCKHVQLELIMEEIIVIASISQAPGRRDMLYVTCVVGAHYVLRALCALETAQRT